MKTIHAYFHRRHGNAVSLTPLGGTGLKVRCNVVTTLGIATLLTTASFGAAADTLVTTSMTYDAGGQVTSTTDPRGLVTTYAIDGLGQKWQQVSPDSGTTTFNYDAYGRLASLTRPGSNQVSYGYDAMGRVTSVTAGGATQTFTYDSCTQGVGRLCSTSDATGITTYGYSPEGWLIGRGFSIGSTAYSFGYGYDAFGQRTTVAYPDGNQAIYTYTRGVVSAVQMKINGVVSNVATSITYQPGDANLSQWTAANGITTTFGYDTDGRLTGIVAPGVQSLALSYDSASRVVGITNGIDGAMTQAFGYDAMSRLNSVSATADSEAFSYDANGNRLTQTLNGASANVTPSSVSNQITSVAGTTNTSYGYDGRGNLTTVGGVSTFNYDAFNRMSAAGGASYYVDPEGQRLLKTVGGVSTYFAPDPAGPLVAETGVSGWIDYIWLNGRVVARVNDGQITTIHTDQTGRPEAMTDASNNVVWRARNFAFDRTVTLTNAVPLNLGFPGQYYDAESGLWNNGFRDYSPSMGRYVESDPIGLAGGSNTYVYVGGNPLSYVDPLGLEQGIAFHAIFLADGGVPQTSGLGNHYYNLWIPLCAGGCTPAEAFNAMRNFSAPGAPPAQDGSRDLMLLGLTSGNPINQTVDPCKMTITNVTKAGHLFGGSVNISIQTRDGVVGAQVVGTGLGPNPIMNQLMGPVIFEGLGFGARESLGGSGL